MYKSIGNKLRQIAKKDGGSCILAQDPNTAPLCVEVTENSTLGNKKTYFKRGLGVVKVDIGVFGVDELDGVTF